MAWYYWLALPPLVFACVSDLRARLIPDWTSIIVIVLGMLAANAAGMIPGSLVSGAICLALGIVFALVGVWGWGDTKLFAAAGLLVGPVLLLPMIGVMAATGALLALAIILLRPFARRHVPARPWPRWVRNEARRIRVAPSVPYAIAISAGVLVAAI